MRKKVTRNSFFSNNAGNFIGNLDLRLSKYADKVVVYSKQNLNFLKKNMVLKIKY